MDFITEDINIDLRHNEIRRLNLSNFDNAGSNLTKVLNITVQLEDNPIQCDCDLAEFFKHIQKDDLKLFHKNVKFVIDDLYCDGPTWIQNKVVKNLKPKDIKCYWSLDWSGKNKKDFCNKICICWEFPIEKRISVDCPNHNFTDIPNIVGINNTEWIRELNLRENYRISILNVC